MVDQSYTKVSKDNFVDYISQYPRHLRPITAKEANEIAIDGGWHDDTMGQWPEGLVAFHRQGRYYVIDAPIV